MTDTQTITAAHLEASYDLVFNANMLHISPPTTLAGLALTASTALKPAGRLLLYGPFAFDGKLEPESNRNFDASLQQRDASWGIRDVADIRQAMKKAGLMFQEAVAMPANNYILVFEKQA
jgi:hypothetical protein